SGPAIPSERDVHVLAQPAPERDVPPVPEIRHAVRREGTIEVLGDARAEQSAEADRHVGPAREAEIEEEVQLRHPQPEAKRVDTRTAGGEDLEVPLAEESDRQHVFGAPPQDAP